MNYAKDDDQDAKLDPSKVTFFGFRDLTAISACSARHWRLVENILTSLPNALQPNGVQVGELDAFRPFAVEA